MESSSADELGGKREHYTRVEEEPSTWQFGLLPYYPLVNAKFVKIGGD